jgi:hypothetical protein
MASPALAQHAGDILLERDHQGRIHTALIDELTDEVIHNTRVFAGEFEDGFTNEPGMDSDVGAFPFPSGIGFNIRKALRVWNGADFDQIPAERIRIRLGNLGPVDTPIADQVVAGFSMQVGSDGQFHHHPGYTLLSPASDGIYLLEMELWSTSSQVLPSRPYWIVFGQNADEEEHIAAIAWVEENLVGCPSDFDGTGFVDTDDFDAFVRAFEAGDFTTDIDGTGFVDTDDFDAFVHAFEAGC